MNSVVRRSSEGTRALSPVAKSKENFSGQLVVLDKEKDGMQLGEIRSENEKRKTTTRPSSGTLEVLKSGEQTVPSFPNESAYPNDVARPSSGRAENKLPEIKRKENLECTCEKDNSICKLCRNLQHQMKHFSINEHKVNQEGMKNHQCKADRVTTDQSVANPNEIPPSNPASNEESDSNQNNGGNGNDVQQSQRNGPAKAPLQLLAKFLTAVMGKEYQEAQTLCDEILEIEPENGTCLQFRNTLKTKLEQDAKDSDDSDSTESEDESDDGDEDSESSEEDSEEDGTADDESEDPVDASKYNLLMGGVPIRKNHKP